jgi:hypothetical protein
MRQCWARPLGGCSSMSGEHGVGDAMFDAKMLEVSGIVPMGAGTKTVAKKRLVANVLCELHNNGLSDLDNEVATLHRHIRTARERNTSAAVSVNGPRLERWCLKLLTNILAAGWVGSMPRMPGAGIVDQVFGYKPIEQPSGLYGVTDYSGTIPADSVYYAVVTPAGDAGHIVGLVVCLSGMLLVLSTSKVDLRPALNGNGDFGYFSLTSAVTHRSSMSKREL